MRVKQIGKQHNLYDDNNTISTSVKHNQIQSYTTLLLSSNFEFMLSFCHKIMQENSVELPSHEKIDFHSFPSVEAVSSFNRLQSTLLNTF